MGLDCGNSFHIGYTFISPIYRCAMLNTQYLEIKRINHFIDYCKRHPRISDNLNISDKIMMLQDFLKME